MENRTPTAQEKLDYANELIAEALAQTKKRDRAKFALRAIEVITSFRLVLVAPADPS